MPDPRPTPTPHAAPYCPQAEWLAHTRSALRDEAADYRPRHLRESEAVTR